MNQRMGRIVAIAWAKNGQVGGIASLAKSPVYSFEYTGLSRLNLVIDFST